MVDDNAPPVTTNQKDTSTVGHGAKNVENAMGGVIDQLQAQLGFPTDETSKKPSEVLTYAVSAQ